MPFALETTSNFNKVFKKITKKNPELKKTFKKKLKEVLEDPFRFKPLRQLLHNVRRVHLMKSFVLLYSIKSDSVVLILIEHHDAVYR